eukprot:scaffold647886_cov41-Prasinocladus_malaysianus.AAC.3
MQCDLVPMEDIKSEKITKLERPMEVACGAFIIPNRDTWAGEKSKGSTRKYYGYGGEDAYFCTIPNK